MATKNLLKILVAVVPSIALITACGNSEEATSTANSKFWNESEIVKHMNLRQSESGGSWTFRTDDGVTCDVAVVLTSASQVELYAGAGDAVSTNPDRTAGVKIVAAEKRTCMDAATDLLDDL